MMKTKPTPNEKKCLLFKKENTFSTNDPAHVSSGYNNVMAVQDFANRTKNISIFDTALAILKKDHMDSNGDFFNSMDTPGASMDDLEDPGNHLKDPGNDFRDLRNHFVDLTNDFVDSMDDLEDAGIDSFHTAKQRKYCAILQYA